MTQFTEPQQALPVFKGICEIVGKICKSGAVFLIMEFVSALPCSEYN